MGLRYLDYESSRGVPNIVVDGSANESTVLTLSHWPGAATPPELSRDLSAEIAFAYLDTPSAHRSVEAVTNNHLDQDGLVSVHVLVDPDLSMQHRDLLVDVAAAGDFGTYRDRRAARASMVIAAWSGDGWGYDEMLARLVALATDPEPYRSIWAAEDLELSASEAAIASGRVTLGEEPDLDLAVVVVPETEARLHPMALHNATGCFRILLVQGRRYRYTDRYETWVQYRSRPTLARVDMGPLAAALAARDRVRWRAGSPGQVSPTLTHEGESALSLDDVVGAVRAHLGAA